MLRLMRSEINSEPVTVSTVGPLGEFPGGEPIEPRSEFLARLRRDELIAQRIDATLSIMSGLQAVGLTPRAAGGNTLVCTIGGTLCRILPDAAQGGYEQWLSGLDAREQPIRETYRRLHRDARLAAEGEA
jgi:hypothetical protein